MISIIKILLSILFVGNSSQELNIDKVLNTQLKGYNKIEYSLVSPTNIDLTSFRIDEDRELKIEGNRAYLPVIKKLNNGKVKNATITLNIKLYKDVLVCSRDLNRKHELSFTDFVVAEKNISGLRFDPINSDAAIENYRTKVRVQENSILQNTMVELIPDIQIGDRINAIYVNNSVSVSFVVTSRSEGVVGEVIRVKRDDKKLFKAKVINNTTVKIIE